MKVTNSKWFNQYGNFSTIGIVVGTGDAGDMRCCVGSGQISNSEDADKEYIAQTGAKFPLQAARVLFPHDFKLCPLSDMTEEQGIYIARLAMSSFLNVKWFQYAFKFGKFTNKKTPLTFKKYVYDTETDKEGNKIEYWKAEMEIPGTRTVSTRRRRTERHD